MNRVIKILILFFFLTGCSRVIALNTKEIQNISLEDFENKGEVYAKVLTEEKKPLIIKIPKGKKIPIEISMNIAYADFENKSNAVSFKEDVYLYLSLSGIYISPNAKDWAPIYDLKAINELYGQKSGSLALSFGAIKEKGAFVKIMIQTYPK